MYIYLLLIFLILFIIIINRKNFVNYGHLANEYFSNQEKYTAVIIEPREHKALEFVMVNFVENLADNWDIILFHGNKNIDFINKMIDTSLERYKDRIKLINLEIDNLTIEDYNKLLTSKDFYKMIPTEVFLIFQTDTMVCPENKDLINDFIKYDYAGAPMKVGLVGNGGLSLRRKSKMLEILEKCEYKNEPEDVYFSIACHTIPLNKPETKEAKSFSVEALYKDNSFGIHKIWNYHNQQTLNEKEKHCTGLLQLRDFNK